MTCREVEQLLKQERRDGPLRNHDALALHLKSCRRCSEALKVVRVSSALFQALREEAEPGPIFYPRLRARLAAPELGQPDATLFHAWGFARRLIPALAAGVLLLAGVTLSMSGSRSTLPVQVRGGTDVYAFSLEEVNLPGVVGQPSRDQMLAFVLTEREGCEARGARCDKQGEGLKKVDRSDDRDAR